MKENGDDASERLAVFYVCIGLGFTGIYFKQPEFLRKTTLVRLHGGAEEGVGEDVTYHGED